MKKLLYDLQLSFIDKASGKFMTEYDSNFNFCRGICENLANDVDITVMVPSEKQTQLFTHIQSAEEFQLTYNQNVFGSRFTDFCNMEELKTAIDKVEPDFIWTNDMVRVPSYKLLTNAKIMSYSHWIDNRIMPKISVDKTFIFRQAEGAWKSDLTMVNSQYGIKLFIDGLYDYFRPNIIEDINKKIIAVPPLIDPYHIVHSEKFEKPTFMFNHRLSSLPYYQHNYDEFVKACNQLDFDFEVLLTNPSGYIVKDLPKYMKIVHTDSYDEYLKILSKCWACVAVFPDSHGTWSMSISDAIIANTLVVVPDRFGYPEMVQKNYPFLFKDTSTLVEQMTNIGKLFKHLNQGVLSSNLNFAINNYSIKTRFKSLLEFLGGE